MPMFFSENTNSMYVYMLYVYIWMHILPLTLRQIKVQKCLLLLQNAKLSVALLIESKFW